MRRLGGRLAGALFPRAPRRPRQISESDADTRWSDLRPADVRVLLENVSNRWWICGGWAIELFTERAERVHRDTDVGCLRDDVDELLRALEGWELFTAARGRLTRHDPADPVPGATTSLWCRRRGSDRWDVQVMIEESLAGSWLYRRHGGVRRPLTDVTWTTPTGLAVLLPEIQLLYKSKEPAAKDRQDFLAALPAMSPEARRWLASALEVTAPGHPWLQTLARWRFDAAARPDAEPLP